MSPALILGVADPHGTVLRSPLFVAIRISQSLIDSLATLSRGNAPQDVPGAAAPQIEAPVYWDFPPDTSTEELLDLRTHWYISGTSCSLELWARRPFKNGFYGELQCICQTPSFEQDELLALLERQVNMEIRSYASQDKNPGEHQDTSFRTKVFERLVWLSIRRYEERGSQL